MEISSSHVMPVSGDSNSFGEFSEGQLQFSHPAPEDLSVSELDKDLIKFLNIRDKKLVSISVQSSINCEISKLEKEDIPLEFYPSGVASEKFLKCATFPSSAKSSSSAASEKQRGVGDGDLDITAEDLEQNGDPKSVTPLCPRSVSFPIARKLVSAMKGSREKEGTPTKRLTVTWAPDVYDPLPTAASHVATTKSTRCKGNNKKNGKNKQKGGGKSSRGSRGKDKKQARKLSGCSTMCLTSSIDDDEKIIGTIEYQPDVENFDVGSPDPFCGHSFLKKSVTKLHFPVAEAT